jgi:beta-galactosidase
VQPELWQLKRSPQPVAFEAVDPGSATPETRVSGQVILNSGAIRVTNLHHFTDLSELEFRWAVTRDGDAIQEGTMELELPPGESAIVTLPYRQTEPVPGAVDHLLISCHTRSDQPWAEKGHEVAWEQFRLPGNWMPVTGTGSGTRDENGMLEENAGMQVRETGEMLTITGDRFSYSFDKRTGCLTSMVVSGTELLKDGMGPRFNVWRAPLANDLDSWNGWHTEMGYTKEWMGKETANGWRSLGLDRLEHTLDEFTVIEAPGKVIVQAESSVHANNHTTGFKVHQRYQVGADGGIRIETDVSPRGNLPRWIPKLGLQMEMAEGFQQIAWFGRGPFETYPDRKTGARVNLYHSTVEEDYVPYMIPQDHGNKTDVYWIRLTDASGTGLEVRRDLPFNASVQKFSTGHLDRAQHTFQLMEEGVVTLNMDHRVSGVGGTANSVLNPYRVFPEEMSFTFYICPIKGTKTSR